MNDTVATDPRLYAIPDIHGHAKGEHKAFTDERPIPLSARMLFLWFYHACRRGWPRFMMVSDHMNYLTFEDPAAINLVRRALKLAQAGDLYGAAETASVEVGHAAVVSEGLRRGMRYSIGAEVDNDPRSRPDAQNIVDAMKPDGMIRSVHFLTIDHPTHGPNWNWPFDNPEFAEVHDLVGSAKTWELYMATLLDAVERLPGHIVGHFYVPAIFGHWPDDATLEGYENAIVDACEARGMAIELNTRFLYRDHSDEERAKYLAAHRRLLAKCKAKNVGIAVGSDAHSPKDQGRGFDQVLALLDECEINELVFPIAGRLARVALRVERKVEPVPDPPAPPIDERKPARKIRPSDVVVPAETLAVLAPAPGGPPPADDQVEAPKPKSRPKRAKAKTPDLDVPAEALPDVAASNGVPKATPEATPAEDPGPPQAVDRAVAHDEGAAAVATDEPTDPVAIERVADVSPEPVDVSNPLDESALAEMVSDVAVEPIVSDDVAPTVDDTETGAVVIAERAPTAARKTRPKATPVKSKAPAAKSKTASAATKSTPKKAVKSAVKTSAKKSTAKKIDVKKSPAKKSAPKKATAKKAPAGKPVRATSAKKSATKKTAAKKTRPKKPQRRR